MENKEETTAEGQDSKLKGTFVPSTSSGTKSHQPEIRHRPASDDDVMTSGVSGRHLQNASKSKEVFVFFRTHFQTSLEVLQGCTANVAGQCGRALVAGPTKFWPISGL